jgi:Tfp pilus assembly protein PilO
MTTARRRRPGWMYVLLGAVVLLLANGAVFFSFTLPRLDRARRATAWTAELRGKLEQESAEYARLRRRAEVLAANQRDTRHFLGETTVSLRSGLTTDLDAIEQALRESGLQAGRRAFQEATMKDLPLTRFGIAMSLTGSQAQVERFLGSFERSSRFLVVERISLRSGKGPAEAGRIQFDVDLSAFYRDERPVEAKPAARRVAARR